jgi:hypothetical protein
MENKVSKFVFWAPRILSIIFVAFMFLMSLDVFDAGLNFWQTLLALFMHNIPALILLVAVIISWKREIAGGIAFILGGLLYILFALKRTGDWQMAMVWSIPISETAFIIGGLYLANWFKKIKNKK